jgi:hypothetical protein
MQTRQRIVVNGFQSPPAEPHADSAEDGKHKVSESRAKVLSAGLSVSSLVLYLSSSSLIIILNKRLMVDDGFKYPLALTGLAQIAGALAGAPLLCQGIACS